MHNLLSNKKRKEINLCISNCANCNFISCQKMRAEPHCNLTTVTDITISDIISTIHAATYRQYSFFMQSLFFLYFFKLCLYVTLKGRKISLLSPYIPSMTQAKPMILMLLRKSLLRHQYSSKICHPHNCELHVGRFNHPSEPFRKISVSNSVIRL